MGLLEARSYIHKIRIKRKKEYTLKYLDELKWGQDINENEFNDLKFMTKQGVRMQLEEEFDIP